MIIIKEKEEIQYKLEIALINLTSMLFIFRTAFPYFKYPFTILFFLGIVYFSIKYRRDLASNMAGFLKNYFLILLLIFILIIWFFLSRKIYLSIFKEIVNSIVVIIQFFLLSLVVRSKEKSEFFITSLIDLIVFFGFLIAILGLADLLTIIILTDSDNLDYNFALIPVLLGLIGIIYKLSIQGTLRGRIIYYLMSLIMYFQVIFSGSRRGIITIIAIMLVIAFLFIISVITGNRLRSLLKGYLKASFFQFLLFIFALFCSYNFLLESSYRFKENTLALIGSKDQERAKYNITYKIFRYINFSKNDADDFPKIYSRIWSADLDMKDPSSGWGKRRHSIVYPLTGYNVGKVPGDAKGYMMDNTCDANILKDDRSYSSTEFQRFRVNEGDIVEASVFCYATRDFNGDSINIALRGDVKGNLIKEFETFKNYTYQGSSKQNLLYNGDFIDSLINWENYFAFTTTLKIVDTPFGKGVNISRVEGSEDWSLSYIGRPVLYHAGHEYKFVFYFRTLRGNPVPFNIGWWVNDSLSGYEKTLSLPLTVKKLENGWNEASCSYRFKETQTLLRTFLNSFQGNSEVEIADIRLYDLDSEEKVPAYLDEISYFWQKLSVRGVCSKGFVEVSLNFSQKNVKDFSKLTGSVIFAYPAINIIRAQANSSISVFGQISGSNLLQQPNSITVIEPDDLLNEAFLLNPAATPLQWNSNLKGLFTTDSTETDLIRGIASKLISEDTTYFGYKSDLSIKPLENSFIGNRVDRWRFAVAIYFKEYSWWQKIFGGGFSFLNWYGSYFDKDKTKTDHPHNPFLSILLFSGIMGAVLYILVLYFALNFFLKYKTKYIILLVFFIITLFFTFFSGGGLLEPPVMGFFMMLPFFIHSVERKYYIYSPGHV